MKTSLDCIPCFVRQALDAGRMIGCNEKTIEQILKRVLLAASNFSLELTPPEMAQTVHRIVREETGNPDPYKKLKEKSTLHANEAAGKAEGFIADSERPFEAAIRFAIAGNILDFGARSDWDESVIEASFDKVQHQPVDSEAVDILYDEIKQAGEVLILGDNAGETVFDKLLIEQFPGSAEVSYAVKGAPIINDATELEAIEAGIEKAARIVPNGADIPGTVLSACSEEFLDIYNRADVVISKGQGNFETLNECERNVYFLFQVKCSVIADKYGLEYGNWIVTSRELIKKGSQEQCV
ncbi:damage-control phosphatase ARMT1 family protein [Sedimentisphaera salicampi]|uniref:damage-control phosphatase ARMT1 family protein n=1 Tax=Sedimentisphaera salicampi TaxID=1941349 RepID=UPI000B9B121D|nr:ARMT1-like domain-containing protein [Sedimentisphaera salicampi]OXU14912.1 hypothetical protein SMSP1_01409 [Sedimentisphaera salicampi]